MTQMSGEMFELVELDPMTGEEDQLLGQGTFAQMRKRMADFLAEAADDWDMERHGWAALRIQPAQETS